MVAVFFTFALSGPLPPKEMGVILGIAVLLDAALVRLLLVPVLLRLLGALGVVAAAVARPRAARRPLRARVAAAASWTMCRCAGPLPSMQRHACRSLVRRSRWARRARRLPDRSTNVPTIWRSWTARHWWGSCRSSGCWPPEPTRASGTSWTPIHPLLRRAKTRRRSPGSMVQRGESSIAVVDAEVASSA